MRMKDGFWDGDAVLLIYHDEGHWANLQCLVHPLTTLVLRNKQFEQAIRFGSILSTLDLPRRIILEAPLVAVILPVFSSSWPVMRIASTSFCSWIATGLSRLSIFAVGFSPCRALTGSKSSLT